MTAGEETAFAFGLALAFGVLRLAHERDCHQRRVRGGAERYHLRVDLRALLLGPPGAVLLRLELSGRDHGCHAGRG